MKAAKTLAIPVFLTIAITPCARAQDASFGCKVLLCAAATVPGWSGIPYCVPVMTQLFRSLARGGGWPVCSEGNAGNVVYDPYKACPVGKFSGNATPLPEGWQSNLTNVFSNVAIPQDATAINPDPNGSVCADPQPLANVCMGYNDVTTCQGVYTSTPRAPNDKSYFVTITTANGAQQFRFDLRGY